MTVEVSDVRPTTSRSSASPAASVQRRDDRVAADDRADRHPHEHGRREQDPRIGESPRHLRDVQRETWNGEQQKSDDVPGVARGQDDGPEDGQHGREQQEIPDERNRDPPRRLPKTETADDAEKEQADG